jgi:hypothetical protein
MGGFSAAMSRRTDLSRGMLWNLAHHMRDLPAVLSRYRSRPPRRSPQPDDGLRNRGAEAVMRPLAIDLFCGLGGWTEGLLAEGFRVIGFDIERHEYGSHRYPAQLLIQDVRTLHGSQFRDAALIVASPPCEAYSYRAMPWKRAKALPPPDNTLFDACFRIQREACDAAGRHVPMIVENVRGAQKWVGRARWNYGSYYLWGDVPALMPFGQVFKVPGYRFDGNGSFQTASVRRQGWFNDVDRTPDSISSSGSKSPRRKAASAMIAKIPLPLARHIAWVYHPSNRKEIP